MRALKGEVAELDRTIALTLAPLEEEKGKAEEVKQGEGLAGNNQSVRINNDGNPAQDKEKTTIHRTSDSKWRH